MRKKTVPKSKSKRPGIANARPPKSAPISVVREKDSPLVAKPEAEDFTPFPARIPPPDDDSGTFPRELARIIVGGVGLYSRLLGGGIEDEAISAEAILGDPYATVFESLAHELKVIQKLETALKVRSDEIKTELIETLATAGIERVAVRGIEMHPVTSFSMRLDPQLLLSNGVSVDVIERSKVKTPYTYMKLNLLPGIELEKPLAIQSGAPK